MHINTIQKRARDFLLIPQKLGGTANASFLRITGKTSRTWVLRRNQHKFCRKRNASCRPGHIDNAVLKRLPQALENIPMKLWEFIKEQHSAVRQCYLPWFRVCSATNQGNS